MNRNLKTIILFSLAFLGAMLASPASAGEAPLLLEDGRLRVALESAAQQEDQIAIGLICTNRCETDETIHFLIPRVDGEDTVFASQWAGEELPLPAGQQTAVTRSILKNTPGEKAGTVSFRIGFQGKLSIPIEIDPDQPGSVRTISLAEAEDTVFRSEIESESGTVPEPIRIYDKITPVEAGKLDYGRAWICLKTEEGLFPFCQIPLEVNQRGDAEATYSGMAFVPEGDPEYPLAGKEETADGRRTFTTEEISLTSPSVFFAALKLTLQQADDGNWILLKQEYKSDELGGTYDSAPLELAEQAEVLAHILEDSPTPRERVDVRSKLLTLDHPLALQARRALDLGEIQIYCEYFFLDDTDLVHPLYTP